MRAYQISVLKLWNRIWSQSRGHSFVRRRTGRIRTFDTTRVSAQIERLEQRAMLSVANVLTTLHATTTYQLVNHATHASSVSYTPAQIQAAYGFDKISNDGSGQTIAIVDAYDDPTVVADLQRFDTQFGLAAPPSLRVMSQTGSTTALPGTDSTKGWEVEESLDVQWAHALAPGANIILVEANSASDADLFAAVSMAAHLPGVSVVSMSFGGGEFSGESSYDSVFTTPAGHQGVTFLASTGDNGAPGGFPAYSSNVVAVGGTTLSANSSGTYVSESGWSGSGGGVSPYESQPSYQHGVVTQSSTNRAIPDVSFDADPNSGVMVCCSFTYGTSNPWITLGGTSFSAPAWGAIVALIDQGRVANGLGTLDGATETLPTLYHLWSTSPSVFHDVTTGNNGHAAGAGYDLVTGLGSPVVNLLTAAMSGGSSSSPSLSKLVIQKSPTSGTAGVTLGTLAVAAANQNGQILSSDHSTVTLTLSSGTFSTGSSTATATAVNGIATFSNLTINATGTYTIIATNSTSATPVTTGNIVINAAALHGLSLQQNPTTGTAGAALSPGVQVVAVDQFGNQLTASTTVTLTLSSGTFSNKSTAVTATTSGGVASFNNLIFGTAGNYTLTASAGSTNGPSFHVTISPAAVTKLVWQTAPVAIAAAGATLSSIVVSVQDAYGNVVTGDSSTVTLTLGSGSFSSGSSTASATVSNGVATFTGLALNTIGTYRITASDSASSATVSSGSLVITPGTISALVVQQSPTSGTAGVALTSLTKVATRDQYGNLVTASSTVTLTVSSGTFAGGSKTVTATTTSGVASFSGLTFNIAGTYTLTASVNSVASPSFSVVINPAVAKTPVWQTAPDTTAVAGTTLDPIVVIADDAFGNQVTANTTVTLKIAGGKFSNGSTMVTAGASGGVATFSSVIINAAGSYTLTASIGTVNTSGSSIAITPAAASKLVWQTAPVNTAVAGTTLSPVVALVEDAFGNVVTSDTSTVTLSLNNGAFGSGSSTATATAVSGIARFSSLAINAVGTYQITASDSASLTTVASGNLLITPAALSSLSMQQNPTTGTAGMVLSPSMKVAALDQYGNLVKASTTVTLTLSGANFSTGSATATATTTNGVASFNGLIINTAGTYTLAASATGATGASFSVTISPAAARQPVWRTAPATSVVAGTALSSILVTAEDAFGNQVSADAQVTLRLTGGKFSDGTSSVAVTASNGIATFSNLTINATGSYTLTAGVGSATTSAAPVTVTPAAATQLVWKTAPVTAAVAGTTLKQVSVAVEDALGNVVTTDNSTVMLTLSSGTFSTNSATATATAVNGIANFGTLAINVTGTYTITASDSPSLIVNVATPHTLKPHAVASLTTVTSGNLVITPAALSSLSFQQNPTTGTAGVALSPAVKVAALDQYGNLLAAATAVTLTLTGGTFSNKGTTVSAVTSGGVATFSNLIMSTVGNYTLTASTGSVSGPSFSVAISPNSVAKLVWQTAPVSTAVAGTTLSTAVIVVQDAYGNVVTGDTSTVTLTLSNGTFSSGSSSATATVSNGLASFSGLAINTSGTYRINASDSSSSATVSSGSVVITAAALASLSLVQNPSTGTAGVAISSMTKVAAHDQFGNLVMANTTVTLTVSGASFAGGGTTVTAVTANGIATFTGLVINSAGTFTLTASVNSVASPSFDVTINPAAAKTPVWQGTPDTAAVAGATLNPIAVVAEDAFGNQITGSTTVTLKVTGGKFANGSTTMSVQASGGMATFSSVAIITAGTCSLTASIGSVTTSAANITISAVAATKLAWQTAPVTTAVAGATLSSIVVAVEDAYGNVVTTDTSTVTLTLSTGTFSSGSSTATATAVKGLATFSGLIISSAGSYRITASNDASLTTVSSGNISITAH